MSEPFELEKWVWDESDFERMGWHDCHIHALAFDPDAFELMLDIDYILGWVHPGEGETYFGFWIAPATLVFENVYEMEIEASSHYGGLEMDAITRGQERGPRNAEHIGKDVAWKWEVECQEGSIRFWASGYKQFIRGAPVLSQSQALDLKTRGLSFERGRTA